MEFLYHITGIYPDWYPKEQRFAPDTPVKGRIGAQDFTKGVGEVILEFFEEWLDEALIRHKWRNPLGIPTKYELKNGRIFDILTYEQKTKVFEGWKGHMVWFDEPPPRDKYIATLRGLIDLGGRCWLTMTPLSEAWIYDEIYVKSDKKRVYVQTVDMKDNTTLKEEEIRTFEDSLTQEEKEARLHGRFMHLSGLIYKEFGEHNICEPPKIGKDWTRYFVIDLHERLPAACLWLAVDPQGNHWIYDELWLENASIENIAQAVHAQEGDLKPRFRFIDPAMDKDNALAGGFNARKELGKGGNDIFCQRASTDPHLGKSRIRHALTPKYSNLTGTKVPQLRVSRWCRKTIYEFQHYIWDEYRKNPADKEGKDRPRKQNDHFMDGLRYIYNSEPRYIKIVEEEEELVYSGDYAKYPTTQTTGRSKGYDDLVEGNKHNAI